MEGGDGGKPQKDYYKILEVDYDATEEDIRLSYRKLALKWHPDKHMGTNDVTAKFQEINEAYRVLSDPDKRLDYDLSGSYEINGYTLREYLSRFKGMILTCNGLGINPPQSGGAERLIVDVAVELASHGHSVNVFTAHHDKNRCFEETITGPFPGCSLWVFHTSPYFHHFHAVCAYIRCIFVALCVLFMWPSFDVILADQVSAVIPLMKIKKSTKIYCWQNNNSLRRIYRKPIDMIEEATTADFTASTLPVHSAILHNRGIEPAVLYPSVDIKQFDRPCSYKLNFLSINRFERKKNIGLAISAFAMLRSLEGFGPPGHNFAKITLTIAGGYDKRLPENVEYLKELKRLAETEGVSDQVKFVTSCPTAERNLLLSECLCVIYTPKDEHFGIVPLEAMAARKPVIACNSGGPTESIKHGVTGFLCDPTPLEFSQAMHNLASDPEVAARMGEEARGHVSRTFSTNVFGKQLNRYVCDVYHRRME